MIWLYRILTLCASPILDTLFCLRMIRGKEDYRRLNERIGMPKIPRPQGKLVWMHGASVGELQSLLPLIDLLLAERDDLHILVTTGTRTSAALAARRLPARAFHQYVPLDYVFSVAGFMNHWQPDVSVFLESEFWPELLHKAPNPILLNARMSDRSYRRYQRLGFWIRPLLKRFITCLTQTDEDARRLKNLGASHTYTNGNLKYDAAPLPVNAEQLAALRCLIDGRPVLVLASTHDPEEILLAEHLAPVQAQVPNLLTIIAPRHPHRGVQITAALRAQGHTTARRSLQEPLTADTTFYVADTIGEMGLWYTLADAVVIGGSFIPHGGQNPLECLKLDAAPLCGPHMENFREMTRNLLDAGAMTQVTDVGMVSETLLPLLTQPKVQEEIRANGRAVLARLSGASARAAKVILAALHTEEPA